MAQVSKKLFLVLSGIFLTFGCVSCSKSLNSEETSVDIVGYSDLNDDERYRVEHLDGITAIAKQFDDAMEALMVGTLSLSGANCLAIENEDGQIYGLILPRKAKLGKEATVNWKNHIFRQGDQIVLGGGASESLPLIAGEHSNCKGLELYWIGGDIALEEEEPELFTRLREEGRVR